MSARKSTLALAAAAAMMVAPWAAREDKEQYHAAPVRFRCAVSALDRRAPRAPNACSMVGDASW